MKTLHPVTHPHVHQPRHHSICHSLPLPPSTPWTTPCTVVTPATRVEKLQSLAHPTHSPTHFSNALPAYTVRTRQVVILHLQWCTPTYYLGGRTSRDGGGAGLTHPFRPSLYTRTSPAPRLPRFRTRLPSSPTLPPVLYHQSMLPLPSYHCATFIVSLYLLPRTKAVQCILPMCSLNVEVHSLPSRSICPLGMSPSI